MLDPANRVNNLKYLKFLHSVRLFVTWDHILTGDKYSSIIIIKELNYKYVLNTLWYENTTFIHSIINIKAAPSDLVHCLVCDTAPGASLMLFFIMYHLVPMPQSFKVIQANI